MPVRDEHKILREIVRRFAKPAAVRGQPRIHTGIGDDAAVLDISRHCRLALSADASLEDVHFSRKLHSPESVGYKALARAVSDLAAMGAQPHSFLLSLALPQSHTGRWLNRFLGGLHRASQTFGITLIGGDTTRHSSIAVQVTVLGTLPRGRGILRKNAKPGDLIFVTGQLGAAELGLRLLPYWPGKPLTRPTKYHPLLSAQAFPQPPIELAQKLARARIPTAMMDISDGLSTDLSRLCDASGVGARVQIEKLPLVRIPRIAAAQKHDPIELALHGGEDYGLLFTVPASRLRQLRAATKNERVSCIGEITRARGVYLLVDNDVRPLHPRGWEPFAHR